jgi:DNA recombination protein RmuC
MAVMALVLILVALAAGGAVALVFRARLAIARGEVARLTPALADAESARDEQLGRVNELERELLTVTGDLRREADRLEGEVEHERALATERLQAVEQANAKASESFKALSADALKDSTAQFLELAKASFGEFQTAARGELDQRQKTITQMVEKVGESLVQVDGKLERLERDRREAQGALQQNLRSVVETQELLRRETGALVSALRKPDVRGRWGEMQLKRVVEMAGMTGYCDFATQPSARSDDGVLRPRRATGRSSTRCPTSSSSSCRGSTS